jgi:hypothetical protein
MAIPERNMNVVVVSITHPIRGYGNRTESSSAVVENVEAHRQPGGPGRGTSKVHGGVSDSEEIPDFFFHLNPWPTAGEVRVGDAINWRRMDPATRKPTGSTFTGEIRRVSEYEGFHRGRLAHVALSVRGGDGTGI